MQYGDQPSMERDYFTVLNDKVTSHMLFDLAAQGYTVDPNVLCFSRPRPAQPTSFPTTTTLTDMGATGEGVQEGGAPPGDPIPISRHLAKETADEAQALQDDEQRANGDA